MSSGSRGTQLPCSGEVPENLLYSHSKRSENRGAWVAQSVKRPTSARVMTSQFVGSSPASGSVLMARSLEPVSASVSPSLSAPPPLTLCLPLSPSVSKINIKKIKKKKKDVLCSLCPSSRISYSCLSFRDSTRPINLLSHLAHCGG